MKQNKRRLFRIGTTSYIYPDKILPNVRKLKGRVDDIELVLFEGEDGHVIPQAKEMRELMAISRNWDLTYTIHLPLQLDLGSSDKDRRFIDGCKVISYLNDCLVLDSAAYVLHLNLPAQARRFVSRWRERVKDSLVKISERIRCPSGKIVIENLHYPFHLIADVVKETGFSVCIDIGHLFFTKEPKAEYLQKYLPDTQVIHWHGIKEGRDHVSLEHTEPSEIKQIMGLLESHQYKGVLTLEVFSQDDFESSMKVLEPYL